MRTDDLIRTLAQDLGPRPDLGRTMMLAWAGAALSATALFLALLGPRPDWAEAVTSLRFLFKPAIPLVLAVAAAGAATRLARPAASLGLWGWALLLPAAGLAVAVLAEFLVLPAAQWGSAALGHSKAFCLVTIPILALAPLAILLTGLARGASTRPALTGAFAGLVAGGISATFYGLYCTEDSPFFVAIWYVGAVGIAAMLGAAVSHRVLRW
jgi:hypothetical protein